MLSQEVKSLKFKVKNESKKLKVDEDNHLELAVLGTIADLVPLTGANRTLVKIGLEKLRETKRPGLLALFHEAAIDPENIGTYEVGFIIAPRLNAAGRIESAMDSLRLLCTKDAMKAFNLALNLGKLNKERQDIMKRTTEDAVSKLKVKNKKSIVAGKSEKKKIIFIGDKSYNPGVIGLVAGKLVEKFYRPAVVLSIGETQAKASVRSINGVNIINLLRTHMDMYVNVGGHPMAAGFTVALDKMPALQGKLEILAEELISDEMLLRSLIIDCELPLSALSFGLYYSIQQLAPFGIKNPEPVFMSSNVTIEDMRLLGRDGNHLKLRISDSGAGNFDAIGFGLGELAKNLSIGDKIDIAYVLDENKWNENVNLQLKIKDLKIV